jgi:tetratricopeptide (TPR) repeat protein
VLARGTDVLKALAYFQRATRLDPADARTWDGYARVALEAGRTSEAKAAFEQAVAKAAEANDMFQRYWATLGLGDIAKTQGSLQGALRHYQAAVAMLEPSAQAKPGDARLQRDLSLSQGRIGDVLRDQGNPAAALENYRAAHRTFEGLAKANPNNVDYQR